MSLIRSRPWRMACVTVLMTSLTSCGFFKKAPTATKDNMAELTSVSQVIPWTQTMINNATEQALINNQVKTGSLFSNPAETTYTTGVFVSNKTTEADKGKTTGTATTDGSKAALTDPLASNVNAYAPPPNALSNAIATPPAVKYRPTLEQAELTDMVYTGRINHDHTVQAVVNVGDRLYRIKVGDRIGKAGWRVSQITNDQVVLMAKGSSHTLHLNNKNSVATAALLNG